MNLNNQHPNQAYWFVLREDQSNVLVSSNNFTLQTALNPVQDTRYVVDSGERQFIQVNEAPETLPVDLVEAEKETEKQDDLFWDKNKIRMLLILMYDKKYKLCTKENWVEISEIIGASPEECNKKYKNLKRTYIRLLKKKKLGQKIKWSFFSLCDEVFKDMKLICPILLETWEDVKIRKLLALYLENIERFRNPASVKREVWSDIAANLGSTEKSCYYKFKNLKRTYLNLLNRSRESGKALKWSYLHYFDRIFYNNNQSTSTWDQDKTKHLLAAYRDVVHKFNNPKITKKELWKEISDKVGVSPSHCDRKFRNLKQTYIRLKTGENFIKFKTKWQYYHDFEEIYNKCWSASKFHRLQDEDYIREMLHYYLENKVKFADPLIKNKRLWKIIAPKIGLSTEGCDKKFRNLKQTYIRLVERKRLTGKGNNWPYFDIFERIFGDNEHDILCTGHDRDIDNLTLSEVKKLMGERMDNVKFDKLIKVVEDSNNIQRERNKILQALLDRK